MLGKRYEIIEELGAGGMGTVYLAKDSQTHQNIALKQLKSEITTPQMIERFKREGEALRELNHPNIVKLLDTFEHNDQHYLVMEYISGRDLSTIIDAEQLSVPQIIKLAIDLADALTRAHKLDIIHRDLKPANVLIGDDNILRLTDFGVAHVGSKYRVTETNAIIGTIYYLPPEALEGHEVDTRADIWAFGVILFEMLTGKRPFEKDSLIGSIAAIMLDDIPDLEAIVPDAPPALIDLIYRMMAKDQQARIPSVRIVGAELEDILKGRNNTPIQTRFETPKPAHYSRALHNLPAQTTPFVGREHELAELEKLIRDPSQRLITVLAPGGMGKTRLALESAERHLDSFKNGVYFVDLTALTEPESIMMAIAEAAYFSFDSQDPRSQEQQLLDFLNNKQIFLVMDNWEHLIEGASLVTKILHAAPDVQILSTSRLRLNQPGETLFHLSGMDFPEWETPEDALEYAAVKLFMNSASRAQPSFELRQDNLDYVARICRLVAGMPLGIVLAASWLSMLSLEEIAAEIASGIDFLEATGGEVPERQRSIQVVFDYSWQMLSEEEQTIAMKLSIFRGGFTREAAQSITGATLRQLMDLVNKSLIRRDPISGRYSIHELARQYAMEKLEASSHLDHVCDAHLAYYANALNERVPHLKGHRQVEALNDIELDFENVRAAWDWGVRSENWKQLTRMVEAMSLFGQMRTRQKEINEFFQSLLTRLRSIANPDDDEEALCLELATWDIYEEKVGDEEQLKIAEYALGLARKRNDPAAIAHSLQTLAQRVGDEGRSDEAEHLLSESVRLYEELGDKSYQARALGVLAYHKAVLGRQSEGAETAGKALALAREAGNKLVMAHALSNLAVFAEETETARQMQQEALTLRRELGIPSGIGWSVMNLCGDYLYTLQLEEAKALYDELVIVTNETNGVALWSGLYGLASLWDFIEENYHAALENAKKSLHFSEQSGNLSVIRNVKNAVGAFQAITGDFRSFLKDAQSTIEFQVESQLIGQIKFTCFGFLFVLEKHNEDIRWVELLSLLNHPTNTPFYSEHAYVKRLQQRLEQSLGAETYQAAWERGQSMELLEVVPALIKEFAALY